jgi:hypothetical protein
MDEKTKQKLKRIVNAVAGITQLINTQHVPTKEISNMLNHDIAEPIKEILKSTN